MSLWWFIWYYRIIIVAFHIPRNADNVLCNFLRTIGRAKILFSILVFFNEHSRFTGQQGKGDAILLTPLYYFHRIYGHLDINQAIAAVSLTLCMASSQDSTGTFGFRAYVANHQPTHPYCCISIVEFDHVFVS